MPQTTVSVTTYTGGDGTKRTQYRTTIPKQLAEAMGADAEDTRIEWSVAAGNKLEAEFITDD
jgi:hypothetical protein